MNVSIVIRTKNEGPIFRKVLDALKAQTFQDFEIIQVDDNSSDGTESLVFEYFPKEKVKIVRVPKGEFTHPYSCNLGAEAATGKFLTYLNGHSIPTTATWLADGLSNFKDETVAGVFAWSFPNPEANRLERLLYNFHANVMHRKREIYRKAKFGVFGTTGAILRKDLWEQYRFSTDFELGGEDTDWARHWMEKGYIFVQDHRFRTYHSHNLSLPDLIRQHFRYKRMLKPSKRNPV